MGLYLCVFDQDEDHEIEGVEVGSYADYDHFVETVTRELEQGIRGSKYPVLALHSDSDGTWSVEESMHLQRELTEISEAFKKLPPVKFNSDWQIEVAKSLGLSHENLYQCFIDVDGEPLIERLIDLCKVAQGVQQPIVFQ